MVFNMTHAMQFISLAYVSLYPLRDLPQVVSEPIFDVSGLMEAARHQGFDSILRGGSAERTNTRIPSGTELDVWR